MVYKVIIAETVMNSEKRKAFTGLMENANDDNQQTPVTASVYRADRRG
jgi:predicted NUDIX family phosphoesterase